MTRFVRYGDAIGGRHADIKEVYFSSVYPSVFKGWHLHKQMELRYMCVRGAVTVFLLDDRIPGAPPLYARVHLDATAARPVGIVIHPGVWNGFASSRRRGTFAPAEGSAITYEHVEESVIVNCANMIHDPDEIVRRTPSAEDFPDGASLEWSLWG